MSELIKRYQGSLIGLAVGDALGTTLEFKPRGSFAPINDIVGGGPFNLKPGEWTDDTSMALCLADSLIKKKSFDPADQLRRYLMWRNKGYLSSNGRCFDVGMTTQRALSEFEKTGKRYCGPKAPEFSGNGSIMRLAPVPLFFANHPAKAIEMSGKSSRTTHGSVYSIDACRYLGALIVGALMGDSKEKILSSYYSPVADYWKNHPLTAPIEEIASGSFKRRNPPDICGSGFVVKSLEAALWAFHNSDSFMDGCLKAVNLGDDADTTGAVYGQLAGAYYGLDLIPKSWREKIALRSQIESMAKTIFEMKFL
ncbi:MAG TPA: ADP-ribosylglycohydrolase family protein [Nitrosopumilaceae archaeon]|nr:ADP-ribosylglycohydrolase family protein [Nitrosopumilaceae archaeon]